MRKQIHELIKNPVKRVHLSSLSFQKWLLLSYSFILMLVLAVGVFLYQISYKQVKAGIDSQDLAVFSSAVRRMDYTLTAISRTAQQLSDNSSFTTLAGSHDTGTDWFNYHAFLAQLDLRSVFPVTQLAENKAFIYMKNSGYIISSSDFLSFASYAQYRLLCTPDMAQKLEAALNVESNRNRFISLKEFDSRRDGYLYFYPVTSGKVFSEKYIQSYLCFLIDQDQAQEYFSGLLRGPCAITARDPAGNIKFSLTAGILPSDAGEIFSTSCDSEYNNWTYTLQQPREQAYYSISHYRTLFTVICGLSVLLGGALIYYLSVVSSRPMDRLTSELILKEQSVSSLTDLVEKNRPLMNESYIRRIMEGNVATDDEMEYIRGELYLNRSGIKYQVLYVEVYPSEDFSVQLGDMAFCLQNFDVLVRDALKRHFPDTGYLYKPSLRIFSVLLASPESMSYDQVMVHNREIFNELHNELLSQYGIWIRGGFGGRNSRLSNTWKSYQQAKDAKSITTAERYVQSYSDFISSNDVYYYPEIVSIQLANAISSGSRGQVEEIFRLISKENTVSRSLSHIQRRQLLTDVRSTLFKERYRLPAIPADHGDEHKNDMMRKQFDIIDRQLEDEMSLKVLESIALELCGFCTQENSPNSLIVKIQEYITENYHDPSLCLTKISDEFNISENYFSSLFKKETDENFSVYLEKLRMMRARELLLNSDTVLSNMYQYLGYNNAASFRRVFKKTYGVSPKEMREQSNG